MSVIGFDTSNYTTSISYYNGVKDISVSKLLPVKMGELGLRQSDAVFHHTKSLPELSDRLFSNVDIKTVSAIGVSTRPRAVEGSYMPCFLVGLSHAKLLSDALHLPLVEVSHQQGHIAAVLHGAKRLELIHTPMLAWHLSGGTTELLLVEPQNGSLCCTKIGGTSDISAGQLIDRTGQLLKLPFPSGKHLDMLSAAAERNDLFRVKCPGMEFSLSGLQNKVQQYHENNTAEDTAAYALRSVANAVFCATVAAQKQYPGLPVIFSGGVASNTMLRKIVAPLNPIFAPPQYSTDNATGVAVLTYQSQEG